MSWRKQKKRPEIFPIACYAIVPTEVFCDAKMCRIYFWPIPGSSQRLRRLHNPLQLEISFGLVIGAWRLDLRALDIADG